MQTDSHIIFLFKVDESTLWAEIASLAGELGLLDKQAFIAMFTKRAKKAGDEKKSTLPQDDIVSFLKPTRARNFCKYHNLWFSWVANSAGCALWNFRYKWTKLLTFVFSDHFEARWDQAI